MPLCSPSPPRCILAIGAPADPPPCPALPKDAPASCDLSSARRLSAVAYCLAWCITVPASVAAPMVMTL